MATNYWRKKKRAFKRWARKKPRFLLVAGLVVLGSFLAYTTAIREHRLSVNPASCTALLQLIAGAESRGNYNAHFGNAANTSVKFTSMSIADVMQWQQEFIAQGNPSSAVGKYQIINTTLTGLVNELGLKPTEKFDEDTQDKMAIALLERRGASAYVNQEITGDEFAAELAKEWAALPRVLGDNPEDSYYAGDGLNKSHINVEQVRSAIEPLHGRS